MKEIQERKKNQTRILAELAPRFISVAAMLIVASLLPSMLINSTIVSMKTAFAQEQKKTPAEIISTVKALLNRTLNEYRNQNFTGAQSLASNAYLDNFEFIEAPLEKHDKSLKESTEIMLREQLRQSIKDKLPLESIQQLVNKIDSNLNKAERLLAQTDSSIKTNANSSVGQTLLPLSSSLNTTNKVLIAGDESDQPYMPSSITIKAGDKVVWVNTNEEAHTVTSGSENSIEKGKQFDSGLLNATNLYLK
jgi:plastocyanin